MRIKTWCEWKTMNQDDCLSNPDYFLFPINHPPPNGVLLGKKISVEHNRMRELNGLECR